MDNNTSALSYESSVGIGFTFNPTLSVNLSSSDLVISNLTPGSSNDSNSINISVATNASYGYTLSVNASSENLVHSNNTSTFSGIATDANLSSLDNSENNNIWGYSTSLDNGSSWSNYNGLSSSSSTTLLDKDNNASSSVDFRIAAKAGSTQPSGTYANTITFTTVTKPTPMNLAESYFAAGKSRYKGYYTMQDMTTEICTNTEVIGEGSQTQLIDIRDDKIYWATKLADGKCWMTQNLDLDLDSDKTYTHWDTDLGWSTENGNSVDENATWKPSSSTINFDGATTNQVTGWVVESNTEPYSANPGDIYYYTSNATENDIKYNSLVECASANHNNCPHYHAGNYYNWSAAVGSNDTSDTNSGNAQNSICPKGWELPTGSIERNLLIEQKIISTANIKNYLDNGFLRIRSEPIYLTRSGFIYTSLRNSTVQGFQWSSTICGNNKACNLVFNSSNLNPTGDNYRYYGYSVRCLAR